MEKRRFPKIKESQEFPKIMYFKVKDDFNFKQILNEIDYSSEEIVFTGMLGVGNDYPLMVRNFASVTVGEKSDFSKDTTNQFTAPTSKFKKGKKVPPSNSSNYYEIIGDTAGGLHDAAYINEDVYDILRRRRPLMDELGKPLYERYVKANRFVYNSTIFTLYTVSFKMGNETISEVTTCVVELTGLYAENAFKPFEWMDDRIEPKFAYTSPKEFCIARLYKLNNKEKNYFIVNEFGELVEEPGEFFMVNFIVEGIENIKPQRVPELGFIKDISKVLKREDYKFGGWYTDAEFKDEFDPFTPVESDLTLYCKWLKIHDVIFFIDAYTSKTESDIVARRVADGEYLNKELIPTCPLENHVFKWVDKSTGEEIDINNIPFRVTGNTVFNAVWDEDVTVDIIDIGDTSKAIIANGVPLSLYTTATDWYIVRNDSEKTVTSFSDLDMSGKDKLFIIGGAYGDNVSTTNISVFGTNEKSNLPYNIQIVGGGCGYDKDHAAKVFEANVTINNGSVTSISIGGIGYSDTQSGELTVNNGYVSTIFGGGILTNLVSPKDIIDEIPYEKIIEMSKNKEITANVGKSIITVNGGNIDNCIGGGDYGHTAHVFMNFNVGIINRVVASSLLLGYVESSHVYVNESATITEFIEMVHRGAIDRCKVVIDGNPSIGNSETIEETIGIRGGIYAGACVSAYVAGSPELFETTTDSEYNIREATIDGTPWGSTFTNIRGIYTDRDKYYLSKAKDYTCILNGFDNYLSLNPDDYTLKIEPSEPEEGETESEVPDTGEVETPDESGVETEVETPEETPEEGGGSTEETETTPDEETGEETETPDNSEEEDGSGNEVEEETVPEEGSENSSNTSGEGSEDTDGTATETPEGENP